MLHYYTLRYDTLTLLDVTVRCITIVFNAFSFVFTVENKKQREQDRISDERQYSKKPSRAVYWSFFILPRSWRKKKNIYIYADSDRRKSQKNSSLQTTTTK